MVDTEELWRKSRSGARAARGFRYQDAVTANLLVGAWSGAYPAYTVTPEGFDDIELEHDGVRYLFQVKSKTAAARPFSPADITRFQDALSDRASQLGLPSRQTALVVERALAETPVSPWAEFNGTLAGAANHFQFADVETRSVDLIVQKLNCLPSVATLVFHMLVRFVGVLGDANGSATQSNRVSASVADVSNIINEALRSIDPTQIERALRQRICEPIDLHTPLNAQGFYRGVDVAPGHLAAGLVFDRPEDVESARQALLSRRAALISGPSGAGKSALQWLTVNALRHGIRWFQIGFAATASDLTAIRDLISGLQPSLQAPVGLVLDDVGRSQSDLWLGLERTVLAQPSVFLLGSIREEDTSLIGQSANHARVPIGLSEPLAEALWERLRESGQSHWPHWREPFERSNGLMLEYIHTLTEGQRLDDLISAQIARRLDEGRFDELSVLRLSACAAFAGASVDVERLVQVLGLTADQYRVAARRLIDEHLLREAADGTLKGLHQLRSAAILHWTHVDGPESVRESAGTTLKIVLSADLARYLSIAVEQLEVSEEDAARILAEQFSNDRALAFITQAFAGFGIITLANAAAQWVEILTSEGLEPAHWWMATLLANARQSMPSTSEEILGFKKLNSALARFDEITTVDRRLLLAKALNEAQAEIQLSDARVADELLSNLAPMSRFPAVSIDEVSLRIDVEPGLEGLFPMLESAYAVDPALAADMVDALGGDQFALDCAFASTPWITRPSLGATDTFKNAVSADRYCISNNPDAELNDEVVAVCRKLIAAAPRADGVVVRAVTATGDELAWPGFGPLASKAMPRANLPAEATVRWNQVFAQIVVARGAAPSETEFAHGAARLLERTASVLERVVRLFARDKVPLLKQEDLTEIEAIATEANAFSAALPPQASTYHKPIQGGESTHHPAPLAATSVCGDILPRLLRYNRANPNRGLASTIAEQIKRLPEVYATPLWRLMDAPPFAALDSIRDSLELLHPAVSELIFAEESYLKIVTKTRRLLPKQAPARLAKACEAAADRRLEAERSALEAFLAASEIQADVRAVTVAPIESVLWPPARLCALVKCDDLLQFLGATEQLDLSASGVFENREIVFVPSYNGVLVPQFGLQFQGRVFLPTATTEMEWVEELGPPVLSSDWVDCFHKGVEAAIEVSSIAAIRNLEALQADEAEVLERAREQLDSAVNDFLGAQDTMDDERFSHAATVIATMAAALGGEEWASEHIVDMEAVASDVIRGEVSKTTTYVVFGRCHIIDWAVDRLGSGASSSE